MLKRIIGKVVMKTLREEMINSVGFLQVCAGHKEGSEVQSEMCLDVKTRKLL